MKREIEFRGRTSKGEWVYGDLVRIPNGDSFDCYIISDFDERDSIYDLWKYAIKVIPETVGQYVGIKDKNGNKIYEYDRVKCKGVETLGTVLFDCGGFGVEFDEPIAEDWTSTALYCLINEEGFAECEVIGNIFDKESDNE